MTAPPVAVAVAPLALGLDKYAPYILGSYAAAAAVFGLLIAAMIARNARVRRELQTLEARRTARPVAYEGLSQDDLDDVTEATSIKAASVEMGDR